MKGSVRRGDDLKQYVEALRGKSTTYKALKKELDDIVAENGVLVRTQHLLEHQLSAAHSIGSGANLGDNIFITNSDDDANTTAKMQQVIQRTYNMLALQQQQAPGTSTTLDMP